MIIKKLILQNFRVFEGRHEIELSPSKNKPIILFGGLNGSGKTSILTAIRLAIYGKMAFDNMLTNQNYIEQLSTLIYKNIETKECGKFASIELTFTYNQSGKTSDFTIVRSWQLGHKDELLLRQDGEELKELNYEQCQGFLNELIPNGVADLFFFDGEKIAALAEDESGKILQAAVRRLLGLDLIEKLRNDLIIYLKRNNANKLGLEYQEKLNQLEQEKNNYMNKAEARRDSAHHIYVQISGILGEIQQKERLFSAEGGAFALTKSQEKEKVETLLKEKENLEKIIRQELDNTFPLALAPTTLDSLLKRLQQEAESKQTQSFIKELHQFLDKLKADMAFRSTTTAKIASEAIQDQLADYLINKQSHDVLFDISERELGRYQQMISQDSDKSKIRFHEAKNRLFELEIALEQATLNILRAPDDEQLLGLFSQIRQLDEERINKINDHTALLEEAKSMLSLALDKAKQIQKFHDQVRSQYNTNSAVSHAQSSLAILDEYSTSLTESRIKALESNFLAAYKRLNRKEHEHLAAKVNPDTFDVELIDSKGQFINRKSLSAGEKQIYAIAILEALGKTSGRQLPVIIDTPLGRLDSKHRDKLVKHYFPLASEQVIILSTDTEIDKYYFRDYLKNNISHSYQIQYDNNTNSSQIKNGYFWQEPSRNKETH
ncbi:DNA sulfur modification protein DndD [Orbus sturtevantii]|uniref:DNA sulfur modification protein DndD n=1 Tax=Orbus sturtevantii TaxID=3074109 RepID=UPI00370D1DA5